MGCAQASTVVDSVSAGKEAEYVVKAPVATFHQSFVLHQKLGKGAFATVYLATKADDEGAQYAVKISDLRATRKGSMGFSQDPAQYDAKRHKALQKEMAVLESVRGHENVVATSAGFIEGSLGYIVMEKCDRSLLQVMEREVKLDESFLRGFLQGMLSGLAYVHSRRIVHRDVKTDNFVFKTMGSKDVVKLCDFGLAGAISSETSEELKGVNGTPPYMAPEMLKSEAYGSKVDAWSVGVIGYVLCFGRFPYIPVEQSGPAMKAAIVSGVPAPPFRVSSGLADSSRSTSSAAAFRDPVSPECLAWMKDLLCRDPARRPTCKESLRSSWFRETTKCHSNSLRPMLSAAKRCGAFDIDIRRVKSPPTPVDMRIQWLQEKHHPRAGEHPAAAGKTPQTGASEVSTEAESGITSKIDSVGSGSACGTITIDGTQRRNKFSV